MELILASASPQRRRLLRRLGLRFRVVPSRAGESSPLRDPRRLVLALALRKAAAAARRYPRAAVLGADTVVYCRGRILTKPSGVRGSRRMLNLLNGSWHRVYTGLVLLRPGLGPLRACIATRVKARRLSSSAISRLAGRHLDKAGGYAVQDRDDPFIEEVSGDFDNVVGLPIKTVLRLLQRAGLAGQKRTSLP